MDESNALAALAALSQATRLRTVRLLVAREPQGVAAGELARLIGAPQNTLSTHLAILAQAGLVRGERHGRSIVYRADVAALRALGLFLLQDCCGGRPDECAPLPADLENDARCLANRPRSNGPSSNKPKSNRPMS